MELAFIVAIIGLSPAYLIAYGDHDGDGNIDLDDYAEFADCLTGPGGGLGTGCGVFDFDTDTDVDAFDFAGFQRVFGQRLADHSIAVLELLVEAAYSSEKRELLHRANRRIEVLRWLVRLAKDRKLFTA